MTTRPMLVTLAILGAMTLFGSNVLAQDLTTGRWGGTRIGPGPSAPDLDVAWRVEKEPGSDGVRITLEHALGSAPLTDVRLEEGRLRYSFLVPGRGNRADCSLALQDDGSYDGTCSSNGVQFRYIFSPPST